jgi:acyl-CoA synthetase (AMP-forming)/AMP-acid ligase II
MTELAPIALPEEPWSPGSLGRLVPGVEAVVVERDSGKRLRPGRAGELWLRGPAMMAGYLGDETATAATIDAQGWLHTGDLGLFDDEDRLFVVDRLKELIKCRGYQVAPAQLEAELALHPAVADAAVVPRPDEEAGERPVAYGPALPDAAAGDPRVARAPRGVVQAAGRGRGRGRDPPQSDRQAPAAGAGRARARAGRGALARGRGERLSDASTPR